MTRYNKKDRTAAVTLRREAVFWMRQRGARWKSIGYAVRGTPDEARRLYAATVRRISGAS